MTSQYIPYYQHHSRPKTLVYLGCICLGFAWILLISQLMLSNVLASVMLFISFLNFKLAYNQAKLPRFAVVLCEDHIQYHHCYGGWSLPWQQLQSIAIPRLIQHGDYQDSHYIGLRLQHLDSFIEQLNPRFISQILTEQRPILRLALATERHDLDIQDKLFESDYYRCEDGRIITGLQAMFAHRMLTLQKLTGFHLWIDLSNIALPSTELLKLSRTYWQQAPRQTKN
ncbi:DUF2982 domain-containing protein [Alginatibacterium sediminis]|uniref:DUF2982 domain-containing protein n=1 Tax=Alginatibacterium sediminis TaxID=2164068 RepID=A0A420EIC9_9ALTE|nr:DUF2982 domain-containing protein [Alginatibacterium sediminis]RKF20407.1 DUF2982 domain-containing protein [Alginatibacterium sediminis]